MSEIMLRRKGLLLTLVGFIVIIGIGLILGYLFSRWNSPSGKDVDPDDSYSSEYLDGYRDGYSDAVHKGASLNDIPSEVLFDYLWENYKQDAFEYFYDRENNPEKYRK